MPKTPRRQLQPTDYALTKMSKIPSRRPMKRTFVPRLDLERYETVPTN